MPAIAVSVCSIAINFDQGTLSECIFWKLNNMDGLQVTVTDHFGTAKTQIGRLMHG